MACPRGGLNRACNVHTAEYYSSVEKNKTKHGVVTSTTATTAGMSFDIAMISDRSIRDHTLWNPSVQSAHNRQICGDWGGFVVHRETGE